MDDTPHFMQHFSLIPDPRKNVHLIEHQLFDIIFVAVAAVVSGADDWQTVALWAQSQETWLRRYCALENGIPSWFTFRRVFRLMDPKALQTAFASWMAEVQSATENAVLAVDGKTIRRSFDRKDGKAPIHVVSAWLTENRVVLAQRKVDDKSNEITTIPELLALLDIQGMTVTIDAIGCQKDIAALVSDKGADFVLAVKDNQPRLYEDVKQAFSELEDDLAAYPGYRTQERGHGRVESREYFLVSDLSWLRDRKKWPNVESIGLARRIRVEGGRTTTEERFFICSFSGDEKRFGEAVRNHWGIENGLHWVLDISFDEDRNRTRKGHGAENFTVVRHAAVNLLNGYTHSRRCGMKAKRLLASADCEIRQRILKI